MKINFDAALWESSSFVTEALACVQSLQWGLDLGFLDTEVEGDALTVSLVIVLDRRLELPTFWLLRIKEWGIVVHTR